MDRDEAERTIRTTVFKSIVEDIRESLASGDKKQLEKDLGELQAHTDGVIRAARVIAAKQPFTDD